MGPLAILLIVGVAGLVIWRLISSYWAGADTHSADVVDGFSPTYASTDGGYDHDSRHPDSPASGSHGASGGWEDHGDAVAESGGDSGGGDGGDGGDADGGDGSGGDD